MKITKKQKKTLADHNRSLTAQRKKVEKLENYMIENVKPANCPVEHYFTNNGSGNDVMCRMFSMAAGIVITGTVYKLECFWILAKGRLRIAEGDSYRDVNQGELIKNHVGTKNSMYAYEDSILYGFVPNPKNSRELKTIVDSISEIPHDELLGMINNKQAQQWSLNHDFN